MQVNTTEATDLELNKKLLAQISSLRAAMKVFTEESAFINEEIVLEKPVSKAEAKDEVIDNDHNNLIVSFLEKKVGVIRTAQGDVEEKDLSQQSTKEAGGLATEPLAKIYLAQKHYDKAIDVYGKLSLKFPEKSSYFASQIDEIIELMGGFG